MLVSACNVVANFGDFNFHSGDAGVADAASGEAGTQPDASDSCSRSETECDNDRDDDCDQLQDCADPDCGSRPICCRPTQIPETSCTGVVDDDCDGQIDCDDPDCASATACCAASSAEVGNSACSDAIDNDCDGVVDCQESACGSQSVCCQASGAERDMASCSDGKDNDCDGKKDCADSDCAVVAKCCTQSEPLEISCGDAKDNDCDGLNDCRDPDCDLSPACICTPSASTETSCTDLQDNDCDKDRDCVDDDCAKNPACCVATGPENNADACTDQTDDDCDGLLDCADPDCAGTLECCVASGAETGEACADDRDNDCDGLLNCQDPNCEGAQACCSQSGAEQGAQACNDSVDNDCDGMLDCADVDCAGSAGCCSVTGVESDQPNDGKDNDCNGLVDIPILNAAYPIQGLPAAGREVALGFAPSIVAGATLECSTRRQGLTPTFGSCPGTGATVNPWDDAASQDPSNDGVWISHVRWRFPTGARSEVFSFKYYLHHSLDGVPKCTSQVSDDAWFAKAAERVAEPKAGFFRPSNPSDTSLLSPFVRVTYDLPDASAIRLEFQQKNRAQTVEMWSLRRRFTLSADRRLLLITRNYSSSRSGKCWAAHFRTHIVQPNGRHFWGYSCDAVVLNRAGVGVCLNGSGGTPVFAHETHDSYANALGWPKAMKFMWRQLLGERGRGKGTVYDDGDYNFDDGFNYRNFTPKCSSLPCSNRDAIFLPHRSLFP